MVDVVSVTYWIWDPVIFIILYLFSFITYYVSRKGFIYFKDDQESYTLIIKSPVSLGFFFVAFSFFFIGLYSLYLALAYFVSVLLVKLFEVFKNGGFRKS